MSDENEIMIFKENESKEGIDSVFAFKDGDILIFRGNTHSTLLNRNDFKVKLEIKFLGSKYCFCYINEEEFISIKKVYFELYKFLDDRTKLQKLQQVNALSYFEFKKVIKLSNDDLINIIYIKGQVQIFKRNDKKYYLWDNSEKMKNAEEIIDLENNSILFKNYDYTSDQLTLKIYDNVNYELLKENKINSVYNGRKRFYFNLPILKIKNKNKFIAAGAKKLYIFSTITLDFETSILLDANIIGITLLDNGDLIFLNYIPKSSVNVNDIFYLSKYKIDFNLNYIIDKKEKEIDDNYCEFKTLIEIEKYINDGIIIISDKINVKAYKNFFMK